MQVRFLLLFIMLWLLLMSVVCMLAPPTVASVQGLFTGLSWHVAFAYAYHT